jgi:hypothetical protein
MIIDIKMMDMVVSVVSIIIVIMLALGIKYLFKKYKRPNGKKGGFISLHVAFAFAIITVLGLTTKNWYITSLAVIMAYLIARGRLDEEQHYLYQVILGGILGISIPIGMFYLYGKYNNSLDSVENDSESRENYDDKPTNAKDDRKEADDSPELSIDDLKD